MALPGNPLEVVSNPHPAGRDANALPALGRHLFVDLWGCAPDRLDDRALLERVAVAAVKATGGTVLQTCAHEFEPHGVTVVVLIAESHLALHSWPEHGYLGADYFTCGQRIDPNGIVAVLREALEPTQVETAEIARGRGRPR